MKIGMLSFKIGAISGFKRKPYQFIGLKRNYNLSAMLCANA
jgi:hypothetical protein